MSDDLRAYTLPEAANRPYTVRALAERWSCSPRHIYNLIERGELQAFYAGGTLRRIAASEVARWENAGSRSESAYTDLEPLEIKPSPRGETPKEGTDTGSAERQARARREASSLRLLMRKQGKPPSQPAPR